MAHDAIEILAAVSLYPTWRQPSWRARPLSQHNDYDVARRTVARGGVEFRAVGWDSRRANRREPCLARCDRRVAAGRDSRPAGLVAWLRRPDLAVRDGGLGVLPGRDASRC